MINFFQESEIKKYLWEKKISGKLFIEIKDHMISQILDIQNGQNLSFDEAFEKTKDNWRVDLMMVRKNVFSREKITKIAYELDRVKNRKLFLKSLFYALSFVTIQLALASVLSESLFLNIHKIFKVVFVFLPFAIVGMYIQQKRLVNKNYKNNIVLNNFFHPLSVFFISVALDNLVILPKNSFKVIYDFINLGSVGEVSTYIFAKSIIAGVFILSFYLFSYFSLIENIRKLKNCEKIYS